INIARGGPGPIRENFTVISGAAPGTISGQVIDARTHGGLVGATVNLLLPESSADDCATSLAGCVVAATTTSDSTASYTFTEPVPPSGTPYYIQASMTGTSTAVLPVSFGSKSTCPGGPDPTNCSISLPNVLLGGTVAVDPAPAAGTNVTVTVMAEL